MLKPKLEQSYVIKGSLERLSIAQPLLPIRFKCIACYATYSNSIIRRFDARCRFRIFTDHPERKKCAPTKVFTEIQKQTGFDFVYATELLDAAGKVSVDIKNASLEKALQEVLKAKMLSYVIEGKIISIKKEEEYKPKSVFTPEIPQNEISGRIMNKENEPLAGASVIIKRTDKGTQTDAEGNFKLKDVLPEDFLVITFTGYKKRILPVGNESAFYLTLDIAKDELDAAIVQAYGTTTKRLTTETLQKLLQKKLKDNQ